MKRFFALCTALSILCLVGCASSDVRKHTKSTSPTIPESITSTEHAEQATMASPNETVKDELSFGFVKDSTNMSVFVYNGEAIEVPFQLNTIKATGHDFGFLIFIGGIPQNYSIQYEDGTVTEESMMQRLTLSEEGTQTFTFLIHPNVGKAGDKLGIEVCGIIYPAFQPTNIDEPSYQYYGSLSHVTPQQVKFEVDAPNGNLQYQTTANGLELSEEIINAIQMISPNSVEEILDGMTYVNLYQNSTSEQTIIAENGIITLHLQLYGGLDGIYNTTIFINHQPVTIDGANYIRSEMQANKMCECEVTLDISDYDYLNTIYAIAAPADDAYLEYAGAKKTNSVLLVNDLKQNSYGAPASSNDSTLPEQSSSESIQQTQPISTSSQNMETVAPISLMDPIWTVFSYFENAEGNEQLLYLNIDNQLVLYDCTAQTEIAVYDLNLKNQSIIRSQLLSSGADGFSIYLEIIQLPETEDANENSTFIGTSNSCENIIYQFDSKLNLIASYSLPELFSQLSLLYYGGMLLDSSTSQLILYGDDSIYFYSLESNKYTPISETIQNQLQGIYISSLVQSSDGSCLAFLGGDRTGQDNCGFYGIIDLSAEKVTSARTENNYGNELHQTGDIIYITDGQDPYESIPTATGIIHCMNLADRSFFDFRVNNMESTVASLIGNKNALVTAAYQLSDDRTKTVGQNIRIYDFTTGEVIAQSYLNQPGKLTKLATTDETILFVINDLEQNQCILYRYHLPE